MESKVKLLGHPVHPMLVVIPLGLFIGGTLFDALFLWRGNPAFAQVGYWNLGVGVLGGLLAAAFGFLDWRGIPSGTRAKRIGVLHAVTNVVVVALFASVWALRADRGDPAPSLGLFVVELVALALGTVGGWLGGELVDRLGVGVAEGAHLNAPSSLGHDTARLGRAAPLASAAARGFDDGSGA